jgi:cell division protein ZapB
MDSELQALEDRIRQAADLAKRLRAENVDLRQKVASLEVDNKRLSERVESTAQKLEALIRQIPE